MFKCISLNNKTFITLLSFKTLPFEAHVIGIYSLFLFPVSKGICQRLSPHSSALVTLRDSVSIWMTRTLGLCPLGFITLAKHPSGHTWAYDSSTAKPNLQLLCLSVPMNNSDEGI